MNTQGIGLGLAIAEHIVKQFDGYIRLESELGQGSTFTFAFRLEKEEEILVSNQDNEKNLINSSHFLFKWKPDDDEDDELGNSDVNDCKYQ